MLAPEREPPAGFESRVLARMQPPATAARPHRLRRRLWPAVVSAAVAAAATAAVVLRATSDDRRLADYYRAALGHGARQRLRGGAAPPPRSVGDRLARQAILSGREFEAGTPDGDLLCDEIVEPGEMDAALARRVELLTSSGVINAAANRRALRIGQEPLDLFRAYMATYAREQAFCHFSPALIRNLERHWDAHSRPL